jgi:hypothetical protein
MPSILVATCLLAAAVRQGDANGLAPRQRQEHFPGGLAFGLGAGRVACGSHRVAKMLVGDHKDDIRLGLAAADGVSAACDAASEAARKMQRSRVPM